MLDVHVCRACWPCKAQSACKTRAIIQIDPDEPAYIALERCSGCGACVRACGFGAISMRQSSGSIASERNSD